MLVKYILQHYLHNPVNVETFYDIIKDRVVQHPDEDELDIVHECVGLLINCESVNEAYRQFSSGQFFLKSRAFNRLNLEQKEEDEFNENPFEVEEGVLKCHGCKGSRTISFCKQTRSSDEPATVF
eukprot:Pgem_evm1s2643